MSYRDIARLTFPQLWNALYQGKPPKPGRTVAGNFRDALANHAKAKAEFVGPAPAEEAAHGI